MQAAAWHLKETRASRKQQTTLGLAVVPLIVGCLIAGAAQWPTAARATLFDIRPVAGEAQHGSITFRTNGVGQLLHQQLAVLNWLAGDQEASEERAPFDCRAIHLQRSHLRRCHRAETKDEAQPECWQDIKDGKRERLARIQILWFLNLLRCCPRPQPRFPVPF